mgnify:FL=1|jgi:hypothetical protein
MVCIFYSHLHFFLPKLEISDRIQLKIAFVFMIIQVKAIDTTSRVTATGGLHSNFFMGIANIDSLPTATMILSISYRSHVQYQGARFLLCKITINVNLQVPPKGYFCIFCLSSRWLPKIIQKFLAPCLLLFIVLTCT